MVRGGLSGEEERFGLGHFQPKKLEIWENQILNPSPRVPVVDVKQEVTQNSNFYGHGDDEFQSSRPAAAWSQIIPVSSPRSCITSLSSNMLDFSYNKAVDGSNTQPLDHSSEVRKRNTNINPFPSPTFFFCLAFIWVNLSIYTEKVLFFFSGFLIFFFAFVLAV